jgi:hypothetical protein
MGDPGLLAPLILPRRRSSADAAYPICVPHILDPITDEQIVRLTGVPTIVRPGIPASEAALVEVIDEIAHASFVLAGSLHAAILAAAYGVPFAFLDTGHVDVPFKWRDFAASVAIQPVFVRNMSEGLELYQDAHVKTIQLPKLRPILDVCPFGVRASALVHATAIDQNADVEEFRALMLKLDELESTGPCTVLKDHGGQTGLRTDDDSREHLSIKRLIKRLLG